jgi:hypothetical protein
MNPAEMRRAVDAILSRGLPGPPGTWGLLDHRDHADDSGEFHIEVTLRTEEKPTIAAIHHSLGSLDRRLRLAILLAFAEPERLHNIDEPQGLLRDYPHLSLRVTALSLSTVKVTIEGDADEIAKMLGNARPPRWRHRLAAAVIAVFSVGVFAVRAGGESTEIKFPSPHEVREMAEKTCGYLPEGSKVTLDFKFLQVEVPCDKPMPRLR